jgi:uncharacterized protein YjbI with pentapeptide repeats
LRHCDNTGEWQEDNLPYVAAWKSLRERIFAGPVDQTTRRRTSLFSNTLVIPHFDIYEGLKIDDPKKVGWRQYLINLRGRDLEGAVLDVAVLPRADLTGAQLHGASLLGAQLQGANLWEAQLQGALLHADLQGAVLNGADLQGAVLQWAHLQGAPLDYAQLQGASLRAAELQGASLEYAGLQGANLVHAGLQGADLAGALLWRAKLDTFFLENIFDAGGKINWSPVLVKYWIPVVNGSPVGDAKPWTDATYAELRQSIEREVLQVRRGPITLDRDMILDQVAILDCKRNDGSTLASCDPSDAMPDSVKQWKKRIETASIDNIPCVKALTAILGDLICSDKANGIYTLRGLLHSVDLRITTGRVDTLPEIPALVKRISSADCPVSKVLIDADRREIFKSLDSWARSSHRQLRVAL